ncbi:MAG: ATP-binding protein [Campylobacterales bacterium]|nr:ATP-binding protein [Campylobacterales bacterium]
MKIKYLEIKNYKQFKDLTLDLTYPQGHEKAGEPLDKICIIGQSGTGKTNLLDIIKSQMNTSSVKTRFTQNEDLQNEKIYFSEAEKDLNQKQNSIQIPKEDQKIIDDLEKESYKLLARDGGNYGISNFEHNMLHDAINSIKNKYQASFIKQLQMPSHVINIDSSAWLILEKKVENYDEERLKHMDKLSNKLLNLDNYEKKDFQREMQEWEAQNENIVENIANKLNTILRFFNLELTKIDENQQSYNALTIKDLSNDTIIDYDNLSTGTKNLIATFIPLKIHTPKDSIILIDEPENSFYPDIQGKLTELYMEVGENNQLIMATHSPLIASSFEPWEVVELKFDSNNQVYREKYYEGENHIDNYTLDPRLLTWTGILTNIFDLKEDSNFTFREKKLMEYASLKAEIKTIENPEEKEKKFKELMKLSKLLGLSN